MKHARPDYDRIQDPAGKIPEDEPVFLIRGHDRAGPETLEAWAYLAEREGASAEIVKIARDHAIAMRVYQAAHGGKVPDLMST